MPAEPELAYMTDVDKSSNFDLPRWQTHQPHIDPLSSTAQAAHAAQASYHYTSGPPPPPPQSLTAGRLPPLQSSTSQSNRQPRISHLMDQDHQLGLNSSQYLSPSQNQLSRSASLSSANVPRGRRHHQPEELEPAINSDSQDYNSNRQRTQGSNYYPPSVAYHSQSMPGQSTQAMGLSSPSQGADPYADVYYNHGSGPPPKRTQPTHDAGHSNQQPPYSPSNSFSTPYTPSSDQRTAGNYHSHSRSQSSVKQESMTPPISATAYSPSSTLHSSSGYQSPYAMETSNPHTPSQNQNHLNAHLPRQTPASTPSSPLSYMHTSHSHTGQYYPQDQPMVIDPPPQKRRASGFRQVRDVRDLQPRLDIPPTSRRMDGNGEYISPLRQLTTHILESYHICNPNFRYESAHNPRRVLTKPSKPSHNDGFDNEDYDYILYVNDWLGADDGHNKYLILDILGQGTFGQVVKCQNMKTHEIVAVKVVKNKPAYFNQSMMEVTILEMLNKTCDPNDEHHILRLRDSFIHKSHLCLVFELLSSNLYELIKQNQFQGLSTQLVKVFMAQLLDALTVLKEARLIHCDLKPENILLKSLQSPTIKVIDFGSACHERQTVYTYIQSRFYRSPEVLLGMSYTASIDMWSLGCIAVELFLGLPLFPGTSEYNQLTRIIEMLGLPPMSMLNTGKQTSQFFDSYDAWNPHANQNEKKYRLKSIEQYSREHNTNEQPGKQYFKATTLPDIINTAPMPAFKSSRHGQELERELNNRASFIDFCQGLLNLNPVTRWTPQQARLHPFITGEKFTKPFVPDGNVPPPPAAAVTDAKRPYGGLVPSQPKGTRAYQDAASYNQHLAQHQVYTAQAATQANNTYRNPYINAQNSQAQQQTPSQPTQATAQSQQLSPSYENASNYQPQQQHHSQYSASQSGGGGHRLTHQSSAGHLGTYNQQYNNTSSAPNASSNALLTPAAPSNSYYPNSRNRANTINQMDSVPPALARLQQMNQDIIAGRNALTPVLNRDDAMREWERRQAGKANPAQPYPQLEYLQQQAEMAAASGLTNWAQTQPNAAGRYQAPPSKLSHSYNPQGIAPTIMVDEDRRDAVMSNVRSAARGDGANAALYGGGTSNAAISSPPQAYSSNSTTSGNRYAQTFAQQQSPGSGNSGGGNGSFDTRGDINNMFIPMQPEQYQFGTATGTSTRHNVAAPPSAVAPSFYGANVVPSGQATPQQQRNPFGVEGVAQSAPPMPMPNIKDQRRNSGMDLWPR